MAKIDKFLQEYLEKIGDGFGIIKIETCVDSEGNLNIKYTDGLDSVFSENLDPSKDLDRALFETVNKLGDYLYRKMDRNSVAKKEGGDWKIYIEPIEIKDETPVDSKQLVLFE